MPNRTAVSPVISSRMWVRSAWLGHANRLGPGAEERRVGVQARWLGPHPISARTLLPARQRNQTGRRCPEDRHEKYQP